MKRYKRSLLAVTEMHMADEGEMKQDDVYVEWWTMVRRIYRGMISDMWHARFN